MPRHFIHSVPRLPKFISVREKDLRRGQGSLEYGGALKVILNASRKSQGPWRLAAFADFEGLVYYQTFTAVCPHDPAMTIPLTALLNSPVANAFVATREIRHNTNETFESIPIPVFSDKQQLELTTLVAEYRTVANSLQEGPLFRLGEASEKTDTAFRQRADRLLRRIDALILVAFDLPPRSERELLDFFAGTLRQVPFRFAEYYPANFEPCFSLHDYMSPDFEKNTAGEVRKRFEPPSEYVLRCLQTAADAFESQE